MAFPGNHSSIDDLVLGTVNAPYRRDIDAVTLARCLTSGAFDDWIVHVATFVTDVRADLILGFAAGHGITDDILASTYFALKERTWERNLALEARLPTGDGGISPR